MAMRTETDTFVFWQVIQDSALFIVLPSVSNDGQPHFFHKSRVGNLRARFLPHT